MRQWKERAHTSEMDANGGRGAGRSDARNRRRGGDYQEVELGRALVPTRNEIMPVDVGAGMPAIPGLPTTDEEERALGIRRPAYIPATSQKRKRRVSGFRVFSGVLSLLLVCIASCAGTAFLGKDRVAGLFSGPLKRQLTPAVISYQGVPTAPAATQGPAAKNVAGVVTARGVDNNYAPVDPTSHFFVGATVYVVLQIRQVPKGTQHTISVRWFLNNQDIQLPPNALVKKQVIQDSNAYFGLTYPQPGVGIAKVYWDKPDSDSGDGADNQYLAATIYFAVQPPVPTPTPSAQGTVTTTPGASPSPSR